MSSESYPLSSFSSHQRKSDPFNRRLITFLVIIGFLTGPLAGCNYVNLFSGLPTPPAPTSTPTAYVPLMDAMVTFRVQLPPNTPPQQPVTLDILDEVTGLALNIEQYEMQAVDELAYEISLPLPIGAMIKYRYSRHGPYQAGEHTSNKSPVRYRMVYVDGPTIVQDLVSAWSDTDFQGPTGRIIGQVTDKNNNSPLPNMLVTAGGYQTITTSNGSFLLEGLPPGTHNLVVYALDGSYRTFQQGARVAPESGTPATIQLVSAPLVNIVFIVSVPADTLSAVPIRLAGNLYQLGNTFADLSGGINTLASRMPVLTPLSDGRYRLALPLPAGADVQYKYTLGDGFWNAEHAQSGDFRLRRLIVPETTTIVEDTVDTWKTEPNGGSVLFDLAVPSNTPDIDFVSIQFNPYGWTEPIPMWRLGQDRWAYVLYSPLDMLETLGYRYCRNDQCSRADDITTAGEASPGRTLEVTGSNQTVKDTVESWIWWSGDEVPGSLDTPEVNQRGLDFVAGIEIQPEYHPTWPPRMPVSLKELQWLGANWVILSPTWSYSRQSPPVLEPVTGRDPLWPDSTATLEQARAFGFNAALNPAPNFTVPMEEWWGKTPHDFAWWIAWFSSYRSFVLHHADLASRNGARALILGGEWVSPALPNGVLPDGTPSGVPLDAETRWRELFTEVRGRYTGTLVWALPASPDGLKVPPFLDAVDQFYLLWSIPREQATAATQGDLKASAARMRDNVIKPLKEQFNKPIMLGLDYPSAESLQIQTQAYQSILLAFNESDLNNGFISRGYFPPVALQDQSSSVHGKPASDVLKFWFPRLLGIPSP